MISVLDNKIKEARKKNAPMNVSPSEWANAMNWSIEAWKCILSGQKWVHDFEICCPEQYYMLINRKGEFILSEAENVSFSNSLANKNWVKNLENQVADMRARNEWMEALQWMKLIEKINQNPLPTPNETDFIKTKNVVKGHKLIRIKSAA